jgi:ComF family protein
MPSGTLTDRLGRIGRAVAATGLDLVLPPSCLACDTSVNVAGTLCPDCWSNIRFISAPYCACCGLPFEIAAAADAVCGECVRVPPVFDRARAAFVYEGVGRDLVLAYKMADRSWLAPTLATWLRRAAAPLLSDDVLVVPVPLHRWRLLTRRFNQSAILAALVARESGTRFAPDLLVRTRRTVSQARLSGTERRRNVRGAFAVRPSRAAIAAGRHILLVDDVMTSGATVSACTNALREAGAASVDIVTLARAGGRHT